MTTIIYKIDTFSKKPYLVIQSIQNKNSEKIKVVFKGVDRGDFEIDGKRYSIKNGEIILSAKEFRGKYAPKVITDEKIYLLSEIFFSEGEVLSGEDLCSLLMKLRADILSLEERVRSLEVLTKSLSERLGLCQSFKL